VLHFNCHAGYGIFIVSLSLAVFCYAERHLFILMTSSAFFIVMLSVALFNVMLSIVSLLLW